MVRRMITEQDTVNHVCIAGAINSDNSALHISANVKSPSLLNS